MSDYVKSILTNQNARWILAPERLGEKKITGKIALRTVFPLTAHSLVFSSAPTTPFWTKCHTTPLSSSSHYLAIFKTSFVKPFLIKRQPGRVPKSIASRFVCVAVPRSPLSPIAFCSSFSLIETMIL
jgi:hypothetical protein